MAPSQVQSEESVGTRDDSIATEDYNRYLSMLDEPYLRELSAEIGASYLRASDADTLLAEIKKLPVAGKDNAPFPLTWLCLMLAMLCLLAGYWPNAVRQWRQRNHQPLSPTLTGMP